MLLSASLYSKHGATYLAHSMRYMFAESIESNNIAAHLYRVRLLDQLSTVEKPAIIASTLVMRQFRRMWVHDFATFTLLTRDGWLLYLGLPDVPPITFPWHQYQLCLCTSAGAIPAPGAQHSCLPTYHPIRSHLPGHKASRFPVKVSREKSIWFPLAPFLQGHCQNSNPLLTPPYDFTYGMTHVALSQE